MKIRELMTVAIRTCNPNDTMNTAAQAMWECDVGCVPVVDDEGVLCGMITDRDMAMAAHMSGLPLWALRVGDAMAAVVYAVEPGGSLSDAAELMKRYQLRRLPVVDAERRLCGLITLGELARSAARRGSKALTAKDVASILAAVSSPRPTAQTETPAVEAKESRPSKAEKAVLRPTPRKARSSGRPARKQKAAR